MARDVYTFAEQEMRRIAREVFAHERKASRNNVPPHIIDPQVWHRQNPRLAKTIADPDATPEYPAQGTSIPKIFPIVFLSGGHRGSASSDSANFSERREKPQAWVFSVTHNYIPENTVLEVWQDMGTTTNYPGNWWTVFRDPIRIGITSAAIAYGANGNVVEYEPDWTDESTVIQTWLCRNWCGYDLEANTQVFFSQRKGVAYIVNAGCSAAGSGVGSG